MEVRSSYLELVAGRIEEVDGECIATHFFAPFAFPLFPQRSIYLRREVREGRRQMSHEGEPIPLVWKSVVLGYLRVWLAWAAFTSPFWLMWGERLDFGRPEWFVVVGLFVAWILVLVVPGRLGGLAKAQRQALFRQTGLYLDPARLSSFELEERKEELERDVEGHGLPIEAGALDEALGSADETQARLAYAYARYAAVFSKDAAFERTADAAWARFGTA